MNDGGPAFPAEGPSKGQFENPGMSLRAYAAIEFAKEWIGPNARAGNAINMPGIAQMGCAMADAMIAELNKEA